VNAVNLSRHSAGQLVRYASALPEVLGLAISTRIEVYCAPSAEADPSSPRLL